MPVVARASEMDRPMKRAILLFLLSTYQLIGFSQPAHNLSASPEDKFVLFFPDAQPGPSTDVIEIRARSGSLETGSPTGHAFVALGKKYSNGSIYFYSVAGFYPEDSSASVRGLRNMLSGPGRVEYKIPDLLNDRVYRADISPEQARVVKHIMKHYPDRDYSLLFNSCVDMVKQIADVLGLKYHKTDLLPDSVVEGIASENSPSQPAIKMAEDTRELREIAASMRAYSDRVLTSTVSEAIQARGPVFTTRPLAPPSTSTLPPRTTMTPQPGSVR